MIMQQQIHADLDAYESCFPQSYRVSHKQTCVAAIVARFNNQTDDSTDGDSTNSTTLSNTTTILQVMGLGMDTEFLPDAAIREEEQHNIKTMIIILGIIDNSNLHRWKHNMEHVFEIVT